MAALAAVVAGISVWQKVAKATASADPSIQEQFRALKLYFSQQKKNPDLNCGFFAQADTVIASTGTVIGTGAGELYAVYAKKGTVATAAYLKVGDDATGSLAATWKLVLPFLAASEEGAYFQPGGMAFALGLSVHSTTTATGSTSSTGATTGQDGFVIYSV